MMVYREVLKKALTLLVAGLIPVLVVCEQPEDKPDYYLGAIEVKSTPEGAEVYLDGRYSGKTNCVLEDIEPGKYSIKLTLSGYWDWESSVTVEARDTAFVHALFTTEEGSIKWKFEPEADDVFSASSPSIGPDGTIYYATNALYAINPDGTEKWSYWSGEQWTDYCTPVISSDGTIYVGYSVWNGYYICALDMNHNLKWKYICEQYSSSNLPFALGSEGTLYLWTNGNGSYLYAFDGSNGGVKWKYSGIYGPPSIGPDGTIYCCGSLKDIMSILAIDPKGFLCWGLEIEWGAIEISIDASGTAYIIDDGYVKAISAGQELWRYDLQSDEALGPVVIDDDGTLYYATGWGPFYAIALNSDGTLKWRKMISETRVGGYAPVLAIGSDGTIYAGSSDQQLYALNPDGSIKWKCYIGEGIISSPAIAEDGTIYCTTDEGNLYAITSSSRGLASSPWPKYAHDNQNTGRAGAP